VSGAQRLAGELAKSIGAGLGHQASRVLQSYGRNAGFAEQSLGRSSKALQKGAVAGRFVRAHHGRTQTQRVIRHRHRPGNHQRPTNVFRA